MRRRLLMNQPDKLYPGQQIEISEECEDVRQAIQQLQFADVGESLMSMINLAMSFADDESSIPRVQQGAGGSGRETAFELSQRLEKSGKYIGNVIRNIDNGIIQPLIESFLEFNMDDPEYGAEKGDFKCVANGFTSFQNRLTKLSGIRQAIEMATGNEELYKRVKFDEIYKEFTELLDIDTDKWFMKDDEFEELEQQQAEAQKEIQQLEMQKIQAEISLTQAKAEAEKVMLEIEVERLKIKQSEEIRNFSPV